MYDVGQVLFIVITSKQQVLPVQVCEQVIKKNLEGEEISYFVRTPADKTVNLSDVGNNVYQDIEEVRSIMLKNVRSVIDKVTTSAIDMAKIKFSYQGPGTGPTSPTVDIEQEFVSSEPLSSKNSSVRVTLDNGTIANVNLPPEMEQ